MKRLLFVIAGAALLPAVALAASLPQPQAATRGASYLASLQQPGGGFGGGSIGADVDVIIAIRAAGYDPARLAASDGTTAAEYVKAHAATATKPADAAGIALGAIAVGLDPANIGGTDVTAAITSGFDASTGRYAADDFSQSIAMLGLACTGGSVAPSAVAALESAQVHADGGWGFQGTSDPDTTAIAVQALLANGVPTADPAVTAAISYFKASQLPDGGWGYAPASNVNSTAYVVQALIAAGQDPVTYVKGGVDPVSYLLAQQRPDGSFPGVSGEIATEQVVPALAGRTFCNAAATTITHQGTPPVANVTATPPGSATGTATTTPPATATTLATGVPGRTQERTPAAPDTGSGAGSSSRPTGALVAALALLTLGGGLAAATIRRNH